MSKPNSLELAKQTKALADKATPGPWDIVGGNSSGYVFHKGGVRTKGQSFSSELDFDAEFIAAARTNAPLLADAVCSLHSQVAALRFALIQCRGAINTALTTVDVPAAREHVALYLERAHAIASEALLGHSHGRETNDATEGSTEGRG